LSLEDPHRAVTFLGYACTGAEVLGGLLLPEKFFLEREADPALRMHRSQLSAAAHDLCRTRSHPAVVEASLAAKLGALYGPSLFAPQKNRANDAFDVADKAQVSVCEAPRRKIDLVLFGFGGNDAGFVPVIAHAIAGHDELVRLWAEKIFDVIYGEAG